MIASPQNEKLKLVRKLRERKHREREGLFATEGEDLVEAGLAAGAEPRFAAHRRRAAGLGGDGGRAGAARRRSRRSARGRGRSPSGRCAGPSAPSAALRLPARRRRPRQRRRDRPHRPRAARRHASCSAPAAPTPTRRRRCGRAWARSSRSRRCGPRWGRRRRRGSALVAHGGEPGWRRSTAPATLCLGAEREGLPAEVLAACDATATIPLRAGGAESLNVAAAAAIALQRISSPADAGGAARCLSGSRRSGAEAAAAIGAAAVERRARGAAGPLPRPQGRADRRSCAGSPSCRRRSAGKVGGGRQRGAQGARGAARERSAERSTRPSSTPGWPPTGSTSPCPGAPPRRLGHLHLITRTTRQIEDIMVGLGYRVVEGPEIEHDYYNFTALNHPPGHPARMLQDTFYVQSHPDAAAAHPHLADADPRDGGPAAADLHRRPRQGLPARLRRHPQPDVPPDGGPGDRRGDHPRRPQGDAAGDAARAIFGGEREVRMRPHFFPFTEPSVEVDVSCFQCERDRRAAGRRALQPLQGPGLDRDPRRRHGRPERARLRRRATATTPSGSRASPSASGSSGWRCCGTASPTCGASSTTTCACWSSSR